MRRTPTIRPVRHRLAAALGAVGLTAGLVVTTAATATAQAGTTVLGLDCTPVDGAGGVRHCSNDGADQRVQVFDGVPIDVDVTLPATGDGPWPTIVMINGLGGEKSQLQANVDTAPSDTPPPLPPNTTRYNNVHFAQQGYAVMVHSTRGFGMSCGFGPFGVGTTGGAKLQQGACADGFVRVGDARYEAREIQHLFGLLVDEGVSEPTKFGSTGFSYGGGISAILGALNDRVMCDGVDRGDLCDGIANGDFAAWTSPAGTPMSMGAIYGQWLWTDLIASVLPNGRFLDFDNDTNFSGLDPVGVYLQSYINALLGLAETRGYVANTLVTDPEWDLERIVVQLQAGEPYDQIIAEVGQDYADRHGAIGVLDDDPAPMLLESGFTDDVFPARESMRLYNEMLRRDPDAPVAMLLGDLGHSRSANRDTVALAFNDAANAFFDFWLKGEGPGIPSGEVTVYETTCPAQGPDAVPDGGPYVGAAWTDLHPTDLTFGDAAEQTVRNPGGNPQIGLEYDPIPQTNPVFATFDPCKQIPAPQYPPGTVALYETTPAADVLMVGFPTIRATVATTGVNGQLNGRLYEVDAATGDHRLITRGVYRLTDNQTGEAVFQLQGNAYTFTAGNTIKLEVSAGDAPQFRQPTFPFQVAVTDLTVELPTRPIPAAPAPTPTPTPTVTPAPTPAAPTTPTLPATGGGLALFGLLTLAGGAAARRRR